MEKNNEGKEILKDVKQTNYNAIIMTILLLMIIAMASFIINDKFLTEQKSCDCPKCVTPKATPVPSATPTSIDDEKDKTLNSAGETFDVSKLLNNKNENSECKKIYKEDLQFDSSYKVKIDNTNSSIALLIDKETYRLDFSKPIKQILLGGYGGDSFEDQIIFYLMEDGTIEYTPTWKLALGSSNNGFKSYGIISKIDGIKSLKNVTWEYSECMVSGGGMTTIGIKEDGNFYDLGIAYTDIK